MKVWVKSLIGSLLALLGFQSCDPATIFNGPDMYGSGPVEYGSPYADYIFKGEASDEQGNPIQGIRVVLFPYGEQEDTVCGDTLFTGADGKVEKRLEYNWVQENDIKVKFEDVDGAENGSFKNKELVGDAVTIKQTSEGKKWYMGEFTITAKAVLEKKEGE